eukprot:jgi/Chrpa1/17100/Chrysochromulina_OHIO_Genome00022894-RA
MIAKPSIQPVALWSPTVLSMTIEIIDMTSSSWIVVSPSASLQNSQYVVSLLSSTRFAPKAL